MSAAVPLAARPYTRWTPAQVATLRERIHTVPWGRLAHLCQHSESATRSKASHLGLTSAVIGDTYTITDLRQCFRVGDATVRGWIDAGWLVGEKGARDWRITPEAVGRFALAHPLEVRHADVPWLLTLVAPYVSRQPDRQTPAQRNRLGKLGPRQAPIAVLTEDDLRY